MWTSISSSLTTAALGTQVSDFANIPIVNVLILAPLGIALLVFAGRRLMALAPRH